MSAARTKQPDLVIVSQPFYPEPVATAQVLTELAEELTAKGLTVNAIAAQPTMVPGGARVPRLIEHKGITILRTWSTRLRKTSALGKLINLTTFFCSACLAMLIKHRRSQLLIVTNPPYLPLLGWLCHAIRRQRFGVVLHDILPEQAELIGFIRPNGLLARGWRKFNALWYRRAAYVIALSPEMAEGALKNANLLGSAQEAQARARTKVIHIWCDDRLIVPRSKSQSIEAVRLGVLDRFVVQYSGNHGRFHDIETLLRLAQSFSPGEGFTFQFIGEGQKKKSVDSCLRSKGASHIYSSSYVPKELLPDSLAMADLGVVAQLPGQERVCYPSKLLGIMAAGRPTLAICPLSCDMARMIRDQQIGFVVANEDIVGARRVLLEAKANPELLRAMGENAVRYLRDHLTLSQAAQAYFELISGKAETSDARLANQLVATHKKDEFERRQVGSPEGSF
jgi:glycosyltransferase involved in cell wall biosynthesis